MSNKLYKVSFSPHIHTKRDVKVIMRDVLISLLPAVAASIYFYKSDAVKLLFSAVIFGALSELTWNKLTKRQFILQDCSSIITSIIIALLMPSYVPIWIPAVGAAFAVIVVKLFFGGLGQNFVNPAAAAKVFLITSWAGLMSKPVSDAVSGASATENVVTIKELFIGYVNGAIGEVSILALLLGGIYLIFRQVIDGKAAISYLLSVLLFSLLIGKNGFATGDAIGGLMCGSVFIAGIYMVNDFATTPLNTIGKIIFGISCGLLTVIFKVIGNNSDGAYYAVLAVNLFTPMIESLSIPKLTKEAL